MEVLLIFLFALLGLIFGSFLNVCIDRLHRNESLVRPASHCESCRHALTPKDLIPIFSYLRLRGRCRYCHTAIAQRSLWVELATGTIFAFLYHHYGLEPELGITIFYSCIFIIVFVVDLEHGLILNKVVYPSMVIALLLALFLPPMWLEKSLTVWVIPDIANAAIGGGIGFILFFVLAIVSRGGMGWGDVKLAALIGMVTGFPLVFVALIMAAILGGVVAIALVVSKKRKREQTIPFGPFLALTALITVFWGNNILTWYIGLM